MLYFPHMAPKKATLPELGEMLSHVVKHMATKDNITRLDRKMTEGFSAINRRLDTIIQIQRDQHAGRIKKPETAIFSRMSSSPKHEHTRHGGFDAQINKMP
jgi:hypothetical protein